MPRGDLAAQISTQTRHPEYAAESHARRGAGDAGSDRNAKINRGTSGTGGDNAMPRSGSGAEQHQNRQSGGVNNASRSREERSEAAKRGWETRRSKDAFK